MIYTHIIDNFKYIATYRENRPSFTNDTPKVNVRESADEAYQRRLMMSQPPKQVEPPKPIM